VVSSSDWSDASVVGNEGTVDWKHPPPRYDKLQSTNKYSLDLREMVVRGLCERGARCKTGNERGSGELEVVEMNKRSRVLLFNSRYNCVPIVCVCVCCTTIVR